VQTNKNQKIIESHGTGHIVWKNFKPGMLPVCADCRSTSLEEQAKPAHPTSVGNPIAQKPSLKRLRYYYAVTVI